MRPLVASRLVKRRSRMFVPTEREAPAQCVAKSHELLVRAGLIRQSMAGVFHLLPMADRYVTGGGGRFC